METKRLTLENGMAIGTKLCEVFGLDASRVVRLHIDIDANDFLVNVSIDMLPPVDVNEVFEHMLKIEKAEQEASD